MKVDNQFIKEHAYIVRTIVRQYDNVNMYQDLMQEGMIGLIEAGRHYKEDMPVSFASYAAWWIRRAVYKAVVHYSHTVNLPEHVQWENVQTSVSLQHVVTQEYGDAITLADVLPSSDDTEENAEKQSKAAYVQQLLGCLNEREKDLICRLYGIGRPAQTSVQVAKEWKVSVTRIQIIQQRALKKCKKNAGKGLYFEKMRQL